MSLYGYGLLLRRRRTPTRARNMVRSHRESMLIRSPPGKGGGVPLSWFHRFVKSVYSIHTKYQIPASTRNSRCVPVGSPLVSRCCVGPTYTTAIQSSPDGLISSMNRLGRLGPVWNTPHGASGFSGSCHLSPKNKRARRARPAYSPNLYDVCIAPQSSRNSPISLTAACSHKQSYFHRVV